jgi:hypothetical protein
MKATGLTPLNSASSATDGSHMSVTVVRTARPDSSQAETSGTAPAGQAGGGTIESARIAPIQAQIAAPSGSEIGAGSTSFAFDGRPLSRRWREVFQASLPDDEA